VANDGTEPESEQPEDGQVQAAANDGTQHPGSADGRLEVVGGEDRLAEEEPDKAGDYPSHHGDGGEHHGFGS